jgi:hypothetical protein
MNVESIVGARLLAVTVSAAVLCGAAVRAQERGGFVVRTPGEPGSARFLLNLESDTIKGAPYSAEVVNVSTQTLSDGNRIVRRSSARVYRDAEGRVRREEARPAGGPAISIIDPVAGVSLSLDSERKVARQMTMPSVQQLNLGSAVDKLAVVLNGQLVKEKFGLGGGAVTLDDTVREHRTEEQLPGRTIEGVWAEGVRRTTTIEAGAIGNERPITVVSEEWTSPDLHALVLTDHTDPRVGTSTYKLVNIVRADPDASLFQVPADYTVLTAGAGGKRGGPPPR